MLWEFASDLYFIKYVFNNLLLFISYCNVIKTIPDLKLLLVELYLNGPRRERTNLLKGLGREGQKN